MDNITFREFMVALTKIMNKSAEDDKLDDVISTYSSEPEKTAPTEDESFLDNLPKNEFPLGKVGKREKGSPRRSRDSSPSPRGGKKRYPYLPKYKDM